MQITAQMVKELRESSGAGMMDCKNALVECKGDIKEAMKYLREKGLGQAAKKADRLASEGLVNVAVNSDFTKATVVEINSETDFVAKNDKFIKLVDETTKLIQENDIDDLDGLAKCKVDGVDFNDYINNQITIIGENLVVRRFKTLKAQVVNGYLHSNGRVAVAIAANCGNADKKEVEKLLRNLSMHIAAMNPKVISYKEFDKNFVEQESVAIKAHVEKENEEFQRLGKHLIKLPEYVSRLQLSDEVLKQVENAAKEELKKEGKPEKIWDKILPGKMDRFIADNTLLDQRDTLLGQFFVMDEKKSVEQVIEEASKKLGDKIEIISFVRYEVGEGLEKKSEDFAAEVAAQMN